MAEAGCMRDLAVQNLEVNGNQTTTGNLSVTGTLNTKQNVVALTGDRTILPSESGSVFTVNTNAGGAFTVTLPNVGNGNNCVFRIICAENTPANDITISSNGNNIVGVLTQGVATVAGGAAVPAGANILSVTGHTSVLFDTTCLIGDYIELVGNGTNYFVSGATSVAGGFTIA